MKTSLKLLITTAISSLIILSVSAIAASADSGVVTASALNVRSGAGTNYRVIGVLYRGAQVEVLGSQNGWYMINYGGTNAYVSGTYLSVSRGTSVSRNSNTTGYAILEYGKNFLGTPYVYGGMSPSGFDCSGFVKYVYAHFGINLPRTSYSQLGVGVAVSRENLQVGDLVFFRGAGHVGIYAGNGNYMHAPQRGRSVCIEPMTRDLYAARRVVR